jgi:hypothetical protein
MEALSRSRPARWAGPPKEASQTSVADCMQLRLPMLPLTRPIGRLAWRWPDGSVSGLVYRLGVDPCPHVVLAMGEVRQLVAFVPMSRSGWVGRAFFCACGHKTQRLYLPRNGSLWRCKWCYHLTPSIDRHEGRVSQRTLAHSVRWATIAARSVSSRQQPRAPGAYLFGPGADWSTLDSSPPKGQWASAIAPIHRF